MVLILPTEFDKEEFMVKLTQRDIDYIIEALENTNYSVFRLMDYAKIIEKLRARS